MLFRFLDSLLDVVLRHIAGVRDGDLLLCAGTQILGGYVDDTVRVDVEGDLDLRDASGSGSDTGQREQTELLVISRELTLTLQDVDLDLRLVIRRSGEHLLLGDRDGGVFVNDLGHDTAEGLNAQ